MAEKKKRTPLQKLVRVLVSIVLAIVILLVGIRVGEKIAFAKFYFNSEKTFATPGMTSGFVGQGLDYLEENDVFLSCGYSAKKGECSMVYVTDKNGKSRKCDLKNADGSNYTGHTGGVAHYKNFVYITGATGCDVFNLDDVLTKSEAKKIGEVNAPVDPAYVEINDGKFYVGSFYRAGNYETPDEQRITTPAGDKNTSLIVAYNLDATATYGVNPTPIAAYSTTSLVQGICFTENDIVLSTSYGLAASHLYYHNWANVNGGATGTYNAGGTNVPLYYIDSANLVKTVTAPPMSEELVYKDGKIYIMTESASNKYIFGKLMSGRHVFAYKNK